jgi:hypothetical protein
MSRETNIWGEDGCKLPDGSWCNACCFLLRIPEIPKEGDTFCPLQTGDRRCNVHNEKSQPPRCKTFRCEKHPDLWADLISRAQLLQLITPEFADQTRSRLGLARPKSASDIINDDLNQRNFNKKK